VRDQAHRAQQSAAMIACALHAGFGAMPNSPLK
jgi:hypothetical protein